MELKTARRIARLTQRELATKAGVDPSTISLLERGRRQNASYESIVRIARALNIEPSELFPVGDLSGASETTGKP
jgi:transcriptional regulator with XRE-family HTH domain